MTLWLVPAALFGGLTYIEGMRTGGGRWDVSRLIGLVGCLFWPVTLPVVLFLARLHYRKTVADRRAKAARGLAAPTLVLTMLLAGCLLAMPFGE